MLIRRHWVDYLATGLFVVLTIWALLFWMKGYSPAAESADTPSIVMETALATANVDPSYLESVRSLTSTASSDEELIEAAKNACAALKTNQSFQSILYFLEQNGGYSPIEAEAIFGAGVASYCSEYALAVESYAESRT